MSVSRILGAALRWLPGIVAAGLVIDLFSHRYVVLNGCATYNVVTGANITLVILGVLLPVMLLPLAIHRWILKRRGRALGGLGSFLLTVALAIVWFDLSVILGMYYDDLTYEPPLVTFPLSNWAAPPEAMEIEAWSKSEQRRQGSEQLRQGWDWNGCRHWDDADEVGIDGMAYVLVLFVSVPTFLITYAASALLALLAQLLASRRRSNLT